LQKTYQKNEMIYTSFSVIYKKQPVSINNMQRKELFLFNLNFSNFRLYKSKIHSFAQNSSQ